MATLQGFNERKVTAPSSLNEPTEEGGGGVMQGVWEGYDRSKLMQDPAFASFLAQFDVDVANTRINRKQALDELRRTYRTRRADFNQTLDNTVRTFDAGAEGRGMAFSGVTDRERARIIGDAVSEFDRYRSTNFANRQNTKLDVRQMLEELRARLIAEQILAAERLTQRDIDTAASEALNNQG